MSFKVLDQALTKHDFHQLRDTVLANDLSFPWYWNGPSTAKTATKTDSNKFVHIIYQAGQFNSQLQTLIQPILEIIKPMALLRVRAQMYPRTETLSYFAWHQDAFDASLSIGAIFSLNTCDGVLELDDGAVVPSRENQLILFNPGRLHRYTNCTDEMARFNIQFNYVPTREMSCNLLLPTS